MSACPSVTTAILAISLQLGCMTAAIGVLLLCAAGRQLKQRNRD
jgi:hypothetical protein